MLGGGVGVARSRRGELAGGRAGRDSEPPTCCSVFAVRRFVCLVGDGAPPYLKRTYRDLVLFLFASDRLKILHLFHFSSVAEF